MVLSGIAHKYAHEQNHKRHIPLLVRFLQASGFFISGAHHRVHHQKLDKNYSLLNGSSDFFANWLIKIIDSVFNISGTEDVVRICQRYVKKYGKDIKIKFVGDIKGEMIVNLKENLFYIAP